MERKTISEIMLTMLLIGVLTSAFNIQPVKASGTIYIKADGSVDPPTAPISSVDNVTYTFTDDVYDEIVVERDDIVVDGAGYILQGTGSETGIDLSGRSNVTIKNTEIKEFDCGIGWDYSNNITIYGNNITNNGNGIVFYESSNNNISSNNIKANKWDGLELISSSNNNISANNNKGITLSGSDNSVSWNTITNNGYGI